MNSRIDNPILRIANYVSSPLFFLLGVTSASGSRRMLHLPPRYGRSRRRCLGPPGGYCELTERSKSDHCTRTKINDDPLHPAPANERKKNSIDRNPFTMILLTLETQKKRKEKFLRLVVFCFFSSW
jgi:hypothetical protein